MFFRTGLVVLVIVQSFYNFSAAKVGQQQDTFSNDSNPWAWVARAQEGLGNSCSGRRG